MAVNFFSVGFGWASIAGTWRGLHPLEEHSVSSLYLTEDLSAGELSAEQREQRVVEILAIGLMRLNRRAGLSKATERVGSTSLPISGDSAASRLESLSDSGLTVSNR
ncbi:hypothetical protein [Roseiconus lacunae]|uniref:hypothetical protein n=1 Tax=Roseiconus lacunae TaxID=2605694 RepID=UPI0013D94F2E